MELKEVFEPVLTFVKSFQKKDKEIASKQAAKDRLKLVLMQDRASVSPDFFEMMKKEIIDVIKKYIEIDEESLEVELTRGLEAGLEGPALYANIPIKNVKPVAPQYDKDDGEEIITEEKAEAAAEEILNQIEEVAKNSENIAKGNEKEAEAYESATEKVEEEVLDNNEIIKEETVEEEIVEEEKEENEDTFEEEVKDDEKPAKTTRKRTTTKSKKS